MQKNWSIKELLSNAAHFTIFSMQLCSALLKTATKKSASSMVTHMGGLIRKVWNGEKNRREGRYGMKTHIGAGFATWDVK